MRVQAGALVEDPLILICSTDWDRKWARLIDEHLSALGLGGSRRVHLMPDAAGMVSQRAAEAIDTARLAVLVITPDYLASRHLVREVLPRLVLRASMVIKHGQTGDIEFLPIIAKECQWGQLPETVCVQVTPELKTPLELRENREVHRVLFQAARKAQEYLGRLKILPVDTAWKRPRDSAVRLGALEPITGRDFQDREKSLHELNVAWMRPETRVINVVAPPGAGKTTLFRQWLQHLSRDNFRGAERVFAWSFDRQTRAGRAATADEFLRRAGEFLVLSDEAAMPYWQRGADLAKEFQRQRSLVVLDGVDPLLETSEVGQAALRDLGLYFFLRKWLAGDQGLCVVASSRPLADFASWQGKALETSELDPLTPVEAVELIQKMKVPGGEGALREAVECAGGHTLSTRLLGTWLAANHNQASGRTADTSNFLLIPRDHLASSFISAYAHLVGNGPELRVLRLLALADQPVELELFQTLISGEPISGITDGLAELDREALGGVLARLRWAGLMEPPVGETLDLPPLVRKHFRAEVESQLQPGWQAVQARFFALLRRPPQEPPTSFRELLTALRAFRHGCLAAAGSEAFRQVLLPQLWGTEDELRFTPTRQLCTRLEALAALLNEATELPQGELDPADRQAVFQLWPRSLRAAGRFEDAAAAAERQMLWARNHGHLDEMGNCLLELTEILLLQGKLKEATRRVNELFVFPDIRDNAQLFRDTVLLSARILQLKGQFKDALNRYELAKSSPATTSRLLGAEYWHCESILDSGDFLKAERTAWRQFEELADKNGLAAAGFALVLVKMYFSLRTHSGDWRYREEAGKHLAAARHASLRAGMVEGMAPVELAAAALHRHEGEFPEATEALIDATALVSRLGLKFLQLECQLEAIRLKLDQGQGRGVPERLEMLRQHVQAALYGRVARDFKQIESRLVVVKRPV
ncbi:MAG TPA: hypothetical protein VFV87_20165 [Pirellulaceae bacterium]|nr:hypothetical protein [Pirellulaceae bacterium]